MVAKRFQYLVLFFLLNSGWALGARVIFLGDSMSTGAFGRQLDSEMRRDHEVFTYAVGGGTPYYWLRKHPVISSSIGYWVKTPTHESKTSYVKAVPKLEALIEWHQPDVIVMQTGTNLYATLRSKRRSKAENVKIIEDLFRETRRVARAAGARVFLISPPDAHPARYPRSLQKEMLDIMKRSIAPYGEVFESGKVTRYELPFPKHDGIHFGPVEAESWARLTASAFRRFSVDSSVERALPAIPTKPLRIAEKPHYMVSPTKMQGQQTEKIPPVRLRLRLNQKSALPVENEVVYRNALAVYEYDILSGGQEAFPDRKIRLAHMVVLNRKLTSSAGYKVGSEFTFDVVPLSNYPKLKSVQMIDGLPLNLDSSLFICKF